MLSRTYRIQRATFKTFGRGLGYHSPLLSLFVYKKPDQSTSQYSFICSKKVHKSAVKRNLLRRRGYASIEAVVNFIKPGYFCVFSYKKGAEGKKFSEIKLQVLQLLKQAKIISN